MSIFLEDYSTHSDSDVIYNLFKPSSFDFNVGESVEICFSENISISDVNDFLAGNPIEFLVGKQNTCFSSIQTTMPVPGLFISKPCISTSWSGLRIVRCRGQSIRLWLERGEEECGQLPSTIKIHFYAERKYRVECGKDWRIVRKEVDYRWPNPLIAIGS